MQDSLKARHIAAMLLSLGLVGFGSTGLSQSPNRDLPDGFVADPLSFRLKSLGTGLSVVHYQLPSGCEKNIQLQIRLHPNDPVLLAVEQARIASEAIFITSDSYPVHLRWWEKLDKPFPWSFLDSRHSDQFRATVKGLQQSGYVVFRNDQLFLGTCDVAFPKGFLGPSAEVDKLVDYGLTPLMEEYLNDWQSKSKSIDDLQSQSAALDADIASSEHTLKQLDDQQAQLAAQIKTLQAELGSKPYDLVRSLAGINYVPGSDYLRPVVQKNFVPIPSTVNVDKQQVPDAVLTPELNDALEKFLIDNRQQLEAWGLGNFTVVSAARTPMNQSSLQDTRPVAAGVLDTGHCLGVAFDFQIAGSGADIKTYYDDHSTPDELAKLLESGKAPSEKQAKHIESYTKDPKGYREKFDQRYKNWKALKALMAKAGLDMTPGEKDANHVFLSKYTGASKASRLFAAQLRIKILGDYLTAMENERITQEQRLKDLKNQVAQKMFTKFNLDSRINEAKDKIAKLQAQLSSLNAQKEQQDRDRAIEAARQNANGRGNAPDHEHPYRNSDGEKQSAGPATPDRPDRPTAPREDHPQASPGGEGGIKDSRSWGDRAVSEHPMPN
jgi:hypothetical protein